MKTFAEFNQKSQAAAEAQAAAEFQHAQIAAELEQQVNQAAELVSAAEEEVEKSNDPAELRYSSGSRPLIQHRKRFQDFIANNPTDPSVKKIVQSRQSAENQLSLAQNIANDATVAHQTHISTPPIVQPQPDQKKKTTPETQPQQAQ